MFRYVLALLIVVVVSEVASACPAGRLRNRAASVVRKVERVRGGLFGRAVVVQASPPPACKAPAVPMPPPAKK